MTKKLGRVLPFLLIWTKSKRTATFFFVKPSLTSTTSTNNVINNTCTIWWKEKLFFSFFQCGVQPWLWKRWQNRRYRWLVRKSPLHSSSLARAERYHCHEPLSLSSTSTPSLGCPKQTFFYLMLQLFLDQGCQMMYRYTTKSFKFIDQ